MREKIRTCLRWTTILLLAASCCDGAQAGSDPLGNLVTAPGGAGLGAAWRLGRSPYRGDGLRVDLVPLYLYEGRYLFLHGDRAGIQLEPARGQHVEVFLAHRYEGFPYNSRPASLEGMAAREPSLDLGASYELRGGWGEAYAELLHDVSGGARGSELRLGLRHEWRAGRLRFWPKLMLSVRDARLNDYYYGVRPEEATPQRPAYAPGAGVNAEAGLYATYALTERWRLLAGVTSTRWSHGVRESPIVQSRFDTQATVGLLYDFSPRHEPWPEAEPLRMRVLAGKGSDCGVWKIVRLVCTSTTTPDRTRIAAAEVGRPFIIGLNGWPLDFVGWLGLLRHFDRGVQPDAWQVDAYMKGYWYGLPWSDRVMTRIGLGVGVSFAHEVPLLEVRDHEETGRNTSRLLNYLDPTIDFSVGDLLGVRSLRKTFLGLGVSHRSGIFATSQLLGNVKGGSNYVYSYLEWEM